MEIKNAFKSLTKFEKGLWILSVLAVAVTFFAFGNTDYLTLCASLIGVTALIFLAKGHWLGQMLIIIFGAFYGFVSYHFRYYGEMITYLGMTVPMALVALIAWLRNPYKDSSEVAVSKLSVRKIPLMLFSTAVVTVAFYFILKALGNANLLVSTVSVTTSFLAAYMTALRTPYYAIGYAANDLVVIALWIFVLKTDKSSIPMIVCFTTFFINDMYGFINWKRMEKRQKKDSSV